MKFCRANSLFVCERSRQGFKTKYGFLVSSHNRAKPAVTRNRWNITTCVRLSFRMFQLLSWKIDHWTVSPEIACFVVLLNESFLDMWNSRWRWDWLLRVSCADKEVRVREKHITQVVMLFQAKYVMQCVWMKLALDDKIAANYQKYHTGCLLIFHSVKGSIACVWMCVCLCVVCVYFA